MTLQAEGPLISVMMPAYNAAKVVPAALDSLQAQTYRHWEAIVVDDGSTDATAAVLEEYARLDARIKPIYAKHGGRGVARNLALEHCHGEYVAMLDADDVTTPTRFTMQLDFLRQHPDIGVVSGQCVSFSGTPEVDMQKLMPWPTSPDEIRDSLLAGRMRILNGASMIRRSLFDTYGGYRIDLRRAQDYEFFRRLAIGGVRMGALPDVLLLYRQDRLIPTAAYFLESESYKHYADALHDGYPGDFAAFQASANGRRLYFMTQLKYVYLFVKLALRYRAIR